MGILPHGGRLIDRTLRGAERAAFLQRASAMPVLEIDGRAQTDLAMLGQGAFSPLMGFMGSDDYHSVLQSMRLACGTVWSLPITLPVSASAADRLQPGRWAALVDDSGQVLGGVEVTEIYSVELEAEAEAVFGTADRAHPGVARLLEGPTLRVAGPVWYLPPAAPAPSDLELTPANARAAFARNGWRTVVAFQTRNPVHRAHEYIQKCALEIVDGLLLHPLMGETKSDDIPADIRLRSYEAILSHYYPQDRVRLALFPAYMRYAGPREAIFHALCRKNYGCTHFIVGRDHAGVGNYYGTYDAQHIFLRFEPDEIGITPLFFEHTFHCKRCGQMASSKTCPHRSEEHVTLSGTKVREMLRNGVLPPAEFTRPEVAQVLSEHMVRS